MKRVSILTCVLCALLGCATSTYMPDPSGQMFPPYRGEITVLTEMPVSGYIRVGVASGEGGLIHSDLDLIAAIKRRARAAGVDTIVLIGDSKVDLNEAWAGQAVKTRYAVLLRKR